jgi:exodeoxyribonuclease V alpha subunit
VNQGLFPDTFPSPRSDFIFIEGDPRGDPPGDRGASVRERLQEIQVSQVREGSRSYPYEEGVIGGENLNTVLQQKMNPNPNPLLRMGRSFHINDKVMQIRNNYQKEVFNGDVGRIMEIDLSEQSMKVSFNGKLVPYEFHELDELVLAYAVSIHKYQGSECPCIIIPIHTSHFKLLNRNLLYTGITREKTCYLGRNKKGSCDRSKKRGSQKKTYRPKGPYRRDLKLAGIDHLFTSLTSGSCVDGAAFQDMLLKAKDRGALFFTCRH